MLQLYAIFFTEDAPALSDRWPRVQRISDRELTALADDPPFKNQLERAALRHDRIVGTALARCSSVVPFRAGVELRSAEAVRELLSLNRVELGRQLEQFRGRVEMGLKAKLDRLPPDIENIRALASDRREALRGSTFDGCYLIEKNEIPGFWRALDSVRSASPATPILGMGPWAAYSFCDRPLRGLSCGA